MLKIGPDILPQSLLSYVAFRVALRDTWAQLERVLSSDAELDCEGFLAEVPFLREAPLHIQLDVLAGTWQKHLLSRMFEANLLEESVVYAACEFAARWVEREPQRVVRALRHGPLDIAVPVDHDLAADLRGLYLRLSHTGDFLLLGQFLDLPPEESRQWKQQLGIDEACLEVLFDTLGRWHVSSGFLNGLNGLVTAAESAHLARLMGVTCPA